MNKNVVLKKHETFMKNGRLYLKLVYEYEDDHGAYELIIPKIDLEIRTYDLPIIIHDSYAGPMNILDCYIKRYSDTFTLLPDDVEVKKNGETHTCKQVAYVTNTLKEKPQEMTIAEIEKKLGYKVKLVSE